MMLLNLQASCGSTLNRRYTSRLIFSSHTVSASSGPLPALREQELAMERDQLSCLSVPPALEVLCLPAIG